jgi:hypothetical protein
MEMQGSDAGIGLQETMRIIFGEGPKNVYNLADILPHRFGPQDLLEDDSQPLLLQQQSHQLEFDSGVLLLSDPGAIPAMRFCAGHAWPLCAV